MNGFKSLFAALLVVAAPLACSPSATGAEPVRVVGFGDSLMAGYELDAGRSFPDRLQAALRAKGHEVEVANAGVSGDTTSGGLARLDWSVPDRTDLVILELGANDALRGVAPEITRKNLDTMMEKLKARGIPVLLAGMLAPPNMGVTYNKDFDAIYPDLARKYAAPLYPFFLDGVTGHPDLQLADGMHPNAAGIDVMVERVLPAVEAMLAAR